MASTTIGRLNIMLTADANGVRTGLLLGEQAVASFGGKITTLYQSIRAQFQLNPFSQMAQWVTGLAASAETAQVQFEVLLGSAKKATDMVAQIRGLDAKTPIDFGGLRDAAVQLLNVETSAEAVVPLLNMMSEASLGSSDKFQRMALAVSQVIGANRVMGGELKQLREAGFNPLKDIAKLTGETVFEVQKRMEAGNVSVRELIQALELATGASGRYYGLNEKASQTLEGRWSALKSSAQLLAIEVGEKLLPAIKGLTEAGLSVTKWVQGLGVETIQTTIKVAAMTAAFVKGVEIAPRIISAGMAIVRMLKALAQGQAIAAALSGPAGLATLAVGLAAAVAAGVTVNAMFDGVARGAEKAGTKANDARKSIAAMFSDATKNGDGEDLITEKLKTLSDESAKVKKNFEDMRRALEGRRGVFPGANSLQTSAGVEAVARAQQEAQLQKELVKLREQEVSALKKIEDETRATKEAIIKKPVVEVTERRI